MHSKVLELELPAHRSRDKSMRLVVMVEGHRERAVWAAWVVCCCVKDFTALY
jgi:hypothetical protein